MTEPDPGYPHHYVGAPASAPVAVPPRVFEMALRAAVRDRPEELPEELLAATPWRVADSLEVLLDEANAAAPGRSRASDGTIGNAAHAALGKGSDHNAWLIYKGKGVVRARDLTNDPALNLPAVFERFRVAAFAGKLPQVVNGGYLIINGRITAEDWSGWHEYTGPNPHVAHGHCSVSLNPAQFDSRAPWGLSAAPAPTPPPSGWTGPDLTGSGTGLRGQAADQPQGPQSNGARVRELQRFLNRVFPAYSSLAEDGWYGGQTAAVLAEFARRSSIPAADGLNIGPKVAAALYRAGFDHPYGATRERAFGHVHRPGRR